MGVQDFFINSNRDFEGKKSLGIFDGDIVCDFRHIQNKKKGM
jgi:hypothetical protein